mmetsp:Transcript_43177/g.101243  ORF Transcript_43177/g.101243 Transcript_43177/m.101243 type:complete len:241 (-) Transcript_43177:196-918(-)
MSSYQTLLTTRFLFLVILTNIFLLQSQPANARLHSPSQLPTLDVKLGNFTGTWYNVEANLFVKTFIYQFGSCAVANCTSLMLKLPSDYFYDNILVNRIFCNTNSFSSLLKFLQFENFKDKQLEDGSLSVLNTGKRLSGRERSIDGVAVPIDGEPGKFYLTQGDIEGQYWIVGIGPIDEKIGLYSYAIISDERSLTLFVLVRSVAEYENTYKKEIASKVNALGFTSFLRKPYRISQENCDA